MNKTCILKNQNLTLGVSICLDVVSIKISISTSTSSKSESQQSRKSWQRQKVRLDSREISVEIKTSRFRFNINVQTKKSRSRLRNLSRSDNFGISWQFFSISIEKCVDFCIFSSRFLNPSRLFIIFRLKRPQQCRDFSTNLDCVLTNLDNLDKSRQISTISTRLDKNLDASKSQLKSLDFKNLDREKKSWSRHDGHSRRFSKVSLDTMDVLDLDLDWSRTSRPPGLPKFVDWKSFWRDF